MKIIITGATSFIGASIIRCLMQNSENHIWAIIRPNSANRKRIPISKNVSVIELDMLDIENVSTYIDEDVDVFFHLAVKLSVNNIKIGRFDLPAFPRFKDNDLLRVRKTEDADRRFLRFPGRIFWGFFKKIPQKISDLEQVCLNLHKQGSRMFH